MESLYYVVTYVCHRRCKHCYDERFRPYTGSALDAQIAQAVAAFPRIIDHLPERMTYFDKEDPQPDGTFKEKVGRVIIAGGEVLTESVRATITYPVIERLVDRYRGRGPDGGAGVRLIVQTTGDLVTEEIIEALLTRGVWMISVSGLDDYHVGLEGDAAQAELMATLSAKFRKFGMRPTGSQAPQRKWNEEDGPVFGFFGATADSWIGKIWPRGRAWQNSLSRATLADNFCNRWSGGLNFLEHRYSGSEVSIEPGGDVYPCCMKTRLAIGNLCQQRLLDILDGVRNNPVYQAISRGRPEEMGVHLGWTPQVFHEKSKTLTKGGLPYQNLCIGCDRFHEEVLRPLLDQGIVASRGVPGSTPTAGGAAPGGTSG